VKPYSSEIEEEFLTTLSHALENLAMAASHYVVKKEVPISAVFDDSLPHDDLFYMGRFDFVIYERGRNGLPVLAIELDGREHMEDQYVKARDRKKEEICRERGFTLIRVRNSYARRYNYIKEVLSEHFKHGKKRQGQDGNGVLSDAA